MFISKPMCVPNIWFLLLIFTCTFFDATYETTFILYIFTTFCIDLSGCLTVQVHSLYHYSSLVLAKGSLTEGVLVDSADNARATVQSGGGDVGREGEVTVVFSQRFLQLDQCASIRIHLPWWVKFCVLSPSLSLSLSLPLPPTLSSY